MGAHHAPTLVDLLYQRLLPRLSIEDAYPDVVFRYRFGRFWRGACPLHGGKDLNFSVDTETLSWCCFSHCGHGSYLAYRNGGESPRGARFIELVREVGDQVGVPVDVAPPSPEQAAESRRAALLDAFAILAGEALGFATGAPVVAYLASRGFSDDPDELARLGFGAYPSQAMLSSLRVPIADLDAAGLTSRGWAGRLLVPWRDEHGRVTTIAARSISDGEPKYLYLRGAPLPLYFGAGRRTRLGPDRTPIIVEGLIDALLLHYSGVANAIAVGGTRVTGDHIDWLVTRSVRSVVLMLDADTAGREATSRWISLLREHAPDIRVRAVPAAAFRGAKDPAELLARDGLEASAGLIDARLPPLACLATDALAGISPTSPSGVRRDGLDAVGQFAATAAGPGRRADLEDLAAIAIEHLGYSEKAVREAIGLDAAGSPPLAVAAPDPSPLGLADDIHRVLDAVGGSLAINLLAHVLRNSSGPVTRELITAHGITGLPSAFLKRENWLDDRDAVRAACLADPTVQVDGGYWAILDAAPGVQADDGMRVNAGRSWEPDEEAELEAQWRRGLPVADMSRLHGRSRGAITSRLRRLGLDEVGPAPIVSAPARKPSPTPAPSDGEKVRAPEGGHSWTQQDEASLSSLWLTGRPLLEIATTLGRTDRAVEARLVALHLVRDRTHARVLGRASSGVRSAAAVGWREDEQETTTPPAPLRRVDPEPVAVREMTEGPEPVTVEIRTEPPPDIQVPTRPLPIAGTPTRGTPCPHGMPRDVCKACNPSRFIRTVAEGRFWRHQG